VRPTIQFSCVLALCVLAVMAQSEQQPLPGPVQPIAFSHKLHAGAQGLKCAMCHKNPEPGERMGLATPALCMQCHEDLRERQTRDQMAARL
jgi:Class III cytochrome C family